MTQKPAIGRIVHYFPRTEELHANNLTLPIAAVITAVWSEQRVNLKLIMDGPEDRWRTSVSLLPAESEDPAGFWVWPPRV